MGALIDSEDSQNYADEYHQRVVDLEDLLWNEDSGSYFDYNHVLKKPHKQFYSSNFGKN